MAQGVHAEFCRSPHSVSNKAVRWAFYLALIFAVTAAFAACDDDPAPAPTTAPTGDTIAPTVTGTLPQIGATGVALDSVIAVTLSEAMNTAATEAAFAISPTLAGSFAWSTGDSVLTFTPAANFAALTTYTITLGTGATDVAGNALATPPTVTATTPGNGVTGVAPNAAISLTFSEAMDTAATEAVFSISPAVGGSFSWSAGNSVLTFTPTANFNLSTSYTVTLGTGARDAVGESLAAQFQFSFTTGSSGPTLSAKFLIASDSGSNPSSVAFDGTNFLSAYQTAGASQTGHKARLVSPAGTLVSSAITLDFGGDPPSVAFDGTNYLLVWQKPPDGPVYGQFVSPAGSVVGPAFIIEPAPSIGSLHASPQSVAFDGTNYLVVWWHHDGNTKNVYGRFVAPNGSLLGASPVAIAALAGVIQQNSAVAFGGGKLLVVWADGRRGVSLPDPCTGGTFANAPTDIFGQFLTPSGLSTPGSLSGANFLIAQNDFLSDNDKVVAFDGSNFLVVWSDEVQDAPCPGGVEGIGVWKASAKLVSPTGSLGSAVAIGSAQAETPALYAAFGGGQFLVTWTDSRNEINGDFVCDAGEGTCLDVYGQFVSPSGAVAGSEFLINGEADNQIGAPVVFGAGKFLAVWVAEPLYGAFLTPP